MSDNGYQQESRAKLGGLYEKTSAKGMKYFVGYFGGFKLLMMPSKDAAQGEPEWSLFAVERAPKDGNASPPGGNSKPAYQGQGSYRAPAPQTRQQPAPRREEPPMPDYPAFDENDMPF